MAAVAVLICELAATTSASGGEYLDAIRRFHESGGLKYQLKATDEGTENATCFAFSPDGDHVCVGGYEGTTRMWSLKTGKEVRRFSTPQSSSSVRCVEYSPDGKLLATCDEMVRVWSAMSGEELFTLSRSYADGFEFTRDSRYLVISELNEVGVMVVDTEDRNAGNIIYRFECRLEPVVPAIRLPNGLQMILVFNDYESLGDREFDATAPVIFDFSTGKVVKRFIDWRDGSSGNRAAYDDLRIYSTALSGDGKFLAAFGSLPRDGTDADGRVIVWEVATGAEVRRFETPNDQGTVYFTPDDQGVGYVDEDGQRGTWNVTTGQIIHDEKLPAGVYGVSPNRRLFVNNAYNSSDRGYWNLIDLASGAPIARFRQFQREGRSLCETSLGVFTESHPIEALSEETTGDRPVFIPARPNQVADPEEPFDPAVFERTSLGGMVPPSQPSDHGVRVVLQDALSESSRTEQQAADAPGHKGDSSETSAGRGSRPLRDGRLMSLNVGVSNYKFDSFRLMFPAKDARDLQSLFLNQQGTTFRQVFTQTYVDREAQSENILEGLRWLSRSCVPEDTAVVLFSGHGVTGQKGLYFLPWEGTPEVINTTCLNWDKVADQLADTRAGKILVLLDCCHAGAFATEHFVGQKALADRLAQKKELMIIGSSSADSVSLEQQDWNNSAFVKAVLEALSGRADGIVPQNPKDGLITTGELLAYSIERVRELTGDRQVPTVFNADAFDSEVVLSTVK